MGIRVFLTGERVGPQLTRRASQDLKKILEAERGAAQDLVDDVIPKVRQDIASAGNFGPAWTDAFQGKIEGEPPTVRIAFTMGGGEPVKWWRTHQYGATIHGRPLLWIPLPFASDARGVRARDYPGRLFRVDRKGGGAPLLLGGTPATPKYVGKASVTIPKRFHILEIIREGAGKFPNFYRARMRSGG